MSRKSRRNPPQRRIRTKQTVGQLEFQDVVYMDKEPDGKGGERVFAVCTCDKWRSSPEATTITKVAMEAKKHVEAGRCQLRKHEAPSETDPRPIEEVAEEIEQAREAAAEDE